MIAIRLLDVELEGQYEEFVLRHETTLLYCSLKYRRLLQGFLGADDRYLIAQRHGDIVGVLPAFLSRPGSFGRILNSLPFYGSNGGVIVADGDDEAALALLAEWRQIASEASVAAATIISSPFDRSPQRYEAHSGHNETDARVGQVSQLVPSSAPDVDAALMAQYHPKRRREVRKAQKAGVIVHEDESDEALAFLVDTHHENMRSIGGLAKPRSFFDSVRRTFTPGRDYRLYVATLEGRRVAALLAFYYNRTVEYFTPVFVEEWRSHQPLCLIIHRAMQDASRASFAYWNWGGTWLTQDGVYDFKRWWGTGDLPYQYYTALRNQELLTASQATLLDEYPFFYVVPFARLRAAATNGPGRAP